MTGQANGQDGMAASVQVVSQELHLFRIGGEAVQQEAGGRSAWQEGRFSAGCMVKEGL